MNEHISTINTCTSEKPTTEDSQDNCSIEPKRRYSEEDVDKTSTRNPATGKTTRSLVDFGQEATMHGLKYIVQPSSLFRRVIWFLVVLAAACLFTSQVYIRTQDYFLYETNADVQVVYTNDVTFPAVTLCNQNSFRLSILADLGLYGFVEDVYDANNITDLNMTSYPLDGLNTETFLRNAAHQKNDLIESCYWNGKPCDMNNDFEAVFTGLGVCYTFNSGVNESIRRVDKPGSTVGLRLVLNVEQYEFTAGPQSDAGVKFLLHGQSETPLMEDMGFAVAPGAHTLVAVHESKVENLPDPHGTCIDGGAPMSDCLSDCETRQAAERCGCRAPHMGQLSDNPAEVCSVQDLFGCIQRDDVQGENSAPTGCSGCNLPCQRTTYGASLSYAQFSPINIEHTLLEDEARRTAVWQKQYTARDVFQRVDESAILENENEYNELLAHTENMQLLMTEMRNNFTAEHILGLLESISYNLWQDQLMLESEGYRIYYMLDNYMNRVRSLESNMGVTKQARQYLSNETTILVTELRDCLEILNDTQRCEHIFVDSWYTFIHLRNVANNLYTSLPQAYNDYVAFVEDVYTNSPISVSNATGHLRCTAGYQAVLSSSPIVSDLINALDAATLQASVGYLTEEYLQAVEALTDLSNNTQFPGFSDLVMATVQDCEWLNTQYYQWQYGLIIPPVVVASDYETKLATDTFVLPALSALGDVLDDALVPIVNATKMNLDGRVRKLELVDMMQDAAYAEAPSAMDAKAGVLLEHVRNLAVDLDRMKHDVKAFFQALFLLDFPVTDSQRLGQSYFVYLARWLNVTTYTSVPDAAVMDEVVDAVFNQMTDPMHDLNDRLEDTVDKLDSALTRQQARLKKFVSQLVMDDAFYKSNFVMVDVYYQELKYNHIQQFPAFEVLSLLGEVGGFIGLMLGASVLSVFEMLDFLVVSAVNRCRSRGVPTKKIRAGHGDAARALA